MLLKLVLAPEVIVVTSDVPEGKVSEAGATPSVTFVVVGLLASLLLKIMYPFAVAPAPGKVAVVQPKSICAEPLAVAVKEVAAAVGSLERVRKVS